MRPSVCLSLSLATAMCGSERFSQPNLCQPNTHHHDTRDVPGQGDSVGADLGGTLEDKRAGSSGDSDKADPSHQRLLQRTPWKGSSELGPPPHLQQLSQPPSPWGGSRARSDHPHRPWSHEGKPFPPHLSLSREPAVHPPALSRHQNPLESDI